MAEPARGEYTAANLAQAPVGLTQAPFGTFRVEQNDPSPLVAATCAEARRVPLDPQATTRIVVADTQDTAWIQIDGGGRTSRAGKLVTQLSVTVTELLPNGDLRVSGEQSLVINQERQQIRVTGQVRPQDITDGNVVLSSRIADATIDYDGAGALTDSQRVPWWQRVRSWFGL